MFDDSPTRSEIARALRPFPRTSAAALNDDVAPGTVWAIFFGEVDDLDRDGFDPAHLRGYAVTDVSGYREDQAIRAGLEILERIFGEQPAPVDPPIWGTPF